MIITNVHEPKHTEGMFVELWPGLENRVEDLKRGIIPIPKNEGEARINSEIHNRINKIRENRRREFI